MRIKPIASGRKGKNDLPEMYKESKLFTRKHPAQKSVEEIPDPKLESIEPGEGERPVNAHEAVDKSDEGTAILKSFLGKPSDTPKVGEPDTTGKLEGKFKVPLNKMIGMLNQLLNAEYGQWMRYYHYAIVLRGHARDALAAEFEAHAGEELEHANKLAMRVLGLGGYPIPKMDAPPSPLKETEDILKELLQREQRGMALYRNVHKECGDNEGTRQILEENMTVEQDHIDELWRYLNNPGAISKAEMSAGRSTMKPEKQKIAEYDHLFARTPEGISGSPTPDLPERGKDWHGTVPGVPDEPQGKDEGDEKEMEEAQGYFREPKDFLASKGQDATDEAIKALAGAARFTSAMVPFTPPQERDFMLQNGFTPEEIDRGAQMTPRLRAEYNRYASSQVAKSLGSFSRIRR